jgi:DNA-binding NarL/FixJ family response regulator
MNRAKVLLVDDHALVRDALGAWLRQDASLDLVGVAVDAEQAIQLAQQTRPNVVLMDIDMPGLKSFEGARRIRDELPGARVIFLSAFVTDHYVEQALRAGAHGYLTKGEPIQEVIRAIDRVARGLTSFSQEISARLVIAEDGPMLQKQHGTRLASLSRREEETLGYLAQARSRKEIAQAMRISAHTVDRHTASVMQKLNIHSRAELCRFAIREGLAQP